MPARRKGEIRLPVVYADVLFLVNFSADFLVLLTVGRVLHLYLRRWRLVVASLVGALYAVPALILIPTYPMQLLSVLLAAAALCLVGFGFGGARRFFRCLALVFLISFLYGGAITVLFGLALRLFGGLTVRADTGGKVLAFLILFLLSSSAVALSRRLRAGAPPVQVGCRIESAGKAKEVVLMSDSGCLLHEPLTGRAVVLLSGHAAEGLVPPSLLSTDPGLIPPLSYEEKKRYYLIPYQTVSGKRLMHGYRPDRAEIGVGKKKRDAAILIGIVPDGAGIPEGCDGILPAELAAL